MLKKNFTFVALVFLFCSSCATQTTESEQNSGIDQPVRGSVQGSVRLDNEFWNVTDAIGMQEDNQYKIALTDRPFDRNDFSLDGKLDSFDILRHDGHTLTLNFDSNGPTMCLDFTNGHGGGSKCNSEFERTIVLRTRTKTRIAGLMQWGEKKSEHIQLSFDVPIQSQLQRTGEPLPNNGGAPGAAVIAHFSACTSGNFELIKAQAHPQRLALMSTTSPAEAKEMTKMLQDTSPNDIKIQGGVVNEDSAIVDFTGNNHGLRVKGVVKLLRFQGRWYVDKTSETIQN